MPALYILQSTTTHRFYIGSTVDLPARIAEHQRGHSPYTSSRGPWVLVYQEPFATLNEARNRERQLKSWKSHRSLQQLINQAKG
jgi:putative endonuclease